MTTRSAERAARAVGRAIERRPGTIVAVFLAVTVVMAAGVGSVTMAAGGADQYTEDFHEAEALESMNEDFFGGGIEGDAESSIELFLEDGNVLSERGLVRQLETQQHLEERTELRIEETSSPAVTVARELDPAASDYDEKIAAVEEATDEELRAAVAAREDAIEGQLSEDFNSVSGTASVALLSASYELPRESGAGSGMAPPAQIDLEESALETVDRVEGNDVGGNVYAIGDGVIQAESNALLADSVVTVGFASIVLILLFLLLAYRDPVDFLVGLLAIAMTLVWTFGFMGYAGVPFGEFNLAIVPLLLAVGIDFGIHVVNRYREERIEGVDMNAAMTIAVAQLGIIFLIVGVTSAVSMFSNLAATLDQLRDFGISATAGLLFTIPIFAVFVPAAKLKADRLREGTRFPEFGSTPFGNRGTSGAVLSAGVSAARVAPVIVLVVAVVVAGAAATAGEEFEGEFSQEAFFPEEDRLETYQELPEPLAPGEYLFVDFLEVADEDFGEGSLALITQTILYVEAPMEEPEALAEVDRAAGFSHEGLETVDREADTESIADDIRAAAEADEEFAAMVETRDRTGNGLPDEDLGPVYDALFESPHGEQTESHLAEDRRSTRVIYELEEGADEAEATAAVREIAETLRVDATATGWTIVNQAITAEVIRSAFRSLAVGLVLTVFVLVGGYAAFERRPWLGALTLLPVLLSVGLLAGTMRILDIPLTPFNAPVFTVAVGLGVDYSAHFTHRFADEFDGGGEEAMYDALETAARGTGGALTGSMLTTTLGLGALYLAIMPMLQSFGVVVALGVLYAYLVSMFVLPSAIVVSRRLRVRVRALDPGLPSLGAKSRG